MDFYVFVHTHYSFGGHPTLSLIPDFLLGDANDFGSAVSEITVTFHCVDSVSSRRPPEPSYATFLANRETLPKITFHRKRGKVSIDAASELIHGAYRNLSNGPSLLMFNAGVGETLAALELLRKRLTAKDNFKLEAFLGHCREAESRLPTTEAELIELAEQIKRKRAERLAAMSPWDALGVDWQDFHADARGILDDPFYWDLSNDFAPHGNDTGADLLAYYCEWLENRPDGAPMEFYRQLIHDWGYSERPTSALEQSVFDEAAVALAFAELKLRAACRPAVVELAQAAIERQRQEALEATDWPHREARLQSLTMLEGKLLAEK